MTDHDLAAIRQNLGLEATDTSQDYRIENMPKSEQFNRLVTWHGFVDYGPTIRDWVESVYGIALDD